MIAALNALLNEPLLLLVILAIGSAIGIGVERLFNGFERAKRAAYWAGRNAKRKNSGGKSVSLVQADKPVVDMAANQLKSVMAASFKSRPVLNKPERRLLCCIDTILAEESPGWRAMAQVSLGEILASQDKDAYWAINSKRVDLLIMDAECRPLHAIEFQGTGHHLGPETAARDAVKKEALRRAGIGYIEVVSGQTPAEVRAILRGVLRKAA